MEILNAVSETALITLRARVIESEKQKPVIEDAAGRELLNKISPLLSIETKKRIMERKLPSTLTRHIALRARKYDSYAKTYIKENLDGMVVSLGCGFDTRYWRVSEKPWKYVEIDLPEVIEVKRKVLGDIAGYVMIGSSVLEKTWIDRISAMQKSKILFLAEGLFMYLTREKVVGIFNNLSEAFSGSQIVFEVVNERYTKGILKKAVETKLKHSLGTDAGSSYNFGVRDAKDVEAFGKNIKVLEEWSYFEDEDIEPGFLKLFRFFKSITRTQWTIKAAIG